MRSRYRAQPTDNRLRRPDIEICRCFLTEKPTSPTYPTTSGIASPAALGRWKGGRIYPATKLSLSRRSRLSRLNGVTTTAGDPPTLLALNRPDPSLGKAHRGLRDEFRWGSLTALSDRRLPCPHPASPRCELCPPMRAREYSPYQCTTHRKETGRSRQGRGKSSSRVSRTLHWSDGGKI